MNSVPVFKTSFLKDFSEKPYLLNLVRMWLLLFITLVLKIKDNCIVFEFVLFVLHVNMKCLVNLWFLESMVK